MIVAELERANNRVAAAERRNVILKLSMVGVLTLRFDRSFFVQRSRQCETEAIQEISALIKTYGINCANIYH